MLVARRVQCRRAKRAEEESLRGVVPLNSSKQVDGNKAARTGLTARRGRLKRRLLAVRGARLPATCVSKIC